MLKRLLPILAVISSLQALTAAAAPAAPAAETPAQRDARMAWFREARFGMFIHWGLYAIPARGEWVMEQAKIRASEYEKYVPQFNPVKFDARQWAKIAKAAGMKYMVITSKHHDGFCLWPSKTGPYNIAATPFKRDILKELAEACKEEGVRFCFYHSIMDWHHGDYAPRRKWNDTAKGTPDMNRYVEGYLKPQLAELITGYDPGILWFDGEWEGTWTQERGLDLYNFCRGLKPDLIVNNRVAKNRQGMAGMSKGENPVGDYGTPEQEVPATGLGNVDWESCITLNGNWGYHKNDHNWKSTKQIVQMLVDVASKGGNLLLNVGPTEEGLIPQPSVERLAEVGRWMEKNGQSIYGTTASPFKSLPGARCTQKPGVLYVHVFDWPKDGKLVLPMKNSVKKASVVADPAQAIEATAGDRGVTLKLPAQAPDAFDTVIAVEIDGPVQGL